MNKKPLEAQIATRNTETKIVFYIDGEKYGFRCDEGFLNQLKVEGGQVIPVLGAWGITNG